MSRETILLIWLGASLTLAVANGIAVVMLWPQRRIPVMGYLWLFFVGLLLTSGTIVVILPLELSGILSDDVQWTQLVFIASQAISAPLNLLYSLALIGKVPSGPIQWLFGRSDGRKV